MSENESAFKRIGRDAEWVCEATRGLVEGETAAYGEASERRGELKRGGSIPVFYEDDGVRVCGVHPVSLSYSGGNILRSCRREPLPLTPAMTANKGGVLLTGSPWAWGASRGLHMQRWITPVLHLNRIIDIRGQEFGRLVYRAQTGVRDVCADAVGEADLVILPVDREYLRRHPSLFESARQEPVWMVYIGSTALEGAGRFMGATSKG